jgi:hypothetical protein
MAYVQKNPNNESIYGRFKVIKIMQDDRGIYSIPDIRSPERIADDLTYYKERSFELRIFHHGIVCNEYTGQYSVMALEQLAVKASIAIQFAEAAIKKLSKA